LKPQEQEPSMSKRTNVETDKKSEIQRDKLEDSEERASAEQPESYKKKETADKVVEIGPDQTDDPIKGIDPPSKP